MQAANRSATPSRFSTSRYRETPPSLDGFPPSNLTSNRLPEIGDRPTSGSVESSMV